MPPTALTAPAVTFRRDLRASDLSAVRQIVESTGYFSEAEAGVAVELAEERLRRGNASGYHFVFADAAPHAAHRGTAATIGYVCFGEIPCTVGSYDLYWIVVHADHRGRGVGRLLLAEAERLIAKSGGRRVYVETAGRPKYEPTRAFYRACGYIEEAALPDFYAPGDAKVIFSRSLITPGS
jgi:ribosomal protein S18 acetylase RimI-like enzyme